jgi:hypothetical protein
MFRKIWIAEQGKTATGLAAIARRLRCDIHGWMMAAAVLSVAGPAAANGVTHALGWRCDRDVQHLVVYAVNFEGERPSTRDGLYIPMASGWENRSQDEAVFACTLGENVYEVVRVSVNLPRPRGRCGGAAWSEYKMLKNGDIVAGFFQGCGGNPLVVVDPGGLRLCNLSWREVVCQRYRGTPIGFGLYGDWRD